MTCTRCQQQRNLAWKITERKNNCSEPH